MDEWVEETQECKNGKTKVKNKKEEKTIILFLFFAFSGG